MKITKTNKSANEIRQEFFDYFSERQHTLLDSAPVVPNNDPTLLFTNAGMNQFKDVFLGTGTRSYTRAVDTQKCIRVSGKHNDLEEVGLDTYHHTYFEMLGNWSFGDYFKSEAINWAWDLLTNQWGIPRERLFATVFAGDEELGLEPDNEAASFWLSNTNIPPDHILHFGEKDNFWEMADTGPCGPNTEIHVDLTEDCSGASLVNADDPRVIEIWNLVFIQYNRSADSSLQSLPAKHVDTGMGFERLVAVLQGTDNYGTDVFSPLMDSISDYVGLRYKIASSEQKIAYRVIADHVRMLSFSIADGALPSNEGRGYVLRRLLRRASRYGRLLDLREPFIHRLVPVIAEIHSKLFPEVMSRMDYISEVIKAEEASFNRTLGRGLEIFSGIVGHIVEKNGTEIPGNDAFRLYDTYGFPLDLTRVMAAEKGMSVEQQGFDVAMADQRQRARNAGKFSFAGVDASEWILQQFLQKQQFVGYDQLEVETFVHKWVHKGDYYHVVLGKTPFYAEGGGQLGDHGTLDVVGTELEVIDTQRNGDFSVCVCSSKNISDSQMKELVGEVIVARVDAQYRRSTSMNHTGTHLLHSSLRSILGDHVHQAGSLVTPGYLRFDFTHWQQIDVDHLDKIERSVNSKIRENHLVEDFSTTFKSAQKLGAQALFGEQYGDEVRVVQIGHQEQISSLELCGGCHVGQTGEIGPFVIKSEGGIARGVRRIEALTGVAAIDYIQSQRESLRNVSSLVGGSLPELGRRTKEMVQNIGKLEKMVKFLEAKRNNQQAAELSKQAEVYGDISLIINVFEEESASNIKYLAESLRTDATRRVSFLVTTFEERLGIACSVSEDLLKATPPISAAKLVKEAVSIVGGGGGGRPSIATAGAKTIANVEGVLTIIRTRIAEISSL